LRILIAVSRYPWPARRGDQLRALQVAGLLAEEHTGVESVTLLTPAPPAGESPPADLPFAHRTYRPSRTAAVAGLARSFASGLPLQAGLFRQPELAARLAELAPAADLAVLQLVRLAPHADDLGDTPFVVDLIDSLALNFERRARYDAAWKRPALALEARRLLAAERRLVERSAGAFLVSERDRAWLAERLSPEAAAKLSVVPLQVEVGEEAPAPPDSPARLVFTGNLGYFVNTDAITHWLAHAWPAVRAAHPELRLTVAGARPTPKVRRAVAAAPGAELVDTPPDLAPHLRGAIAALAPMRAGSGVPVKVLEAWAAGVPVIATPWAAAGAAGGAGMDLLVAETAEEWVGAVGRVLEDEGLRRRLEVAGRGKVEKEHGRFAALDALAKRHMKFFRL
jgi:glycosyltransferase involved in cell wall biosynthesis